MGDLQQFLLFLATSLVVLVVPGPAILYVIAETVDRGRRAGLFAAVGLTAGNLVHAGAAAAGLSALLATSATAFGVVKYLGAAYLIVLGVQQLRRARREPAEPPRRAKGLAAPPAAPAWPSFRRGLVVNVLNPKIAVFFLAFFPQFVNPSVGSTVSQFLVLGTVFALLTLVVDVVYAVATSGAASLARRRWAALRHGSLARLGRQLPGVVYIGLGVATALTPAARR